jgi:hypothetical protein
MCASEMRTYQAKRTPRVVRSLSRSWFELTTEEQKAVVLVLALFLLGLLVRYSRR